MSGWTPAVDALPASDVEAVQVLCLVLPNAAPTDGMPRSIDCAVSSGDHGEGDTFVSIGWYDDESDEWHVAGYDMTQDCWTDARRFTVLGWQSLANTQL